MKEFLRRHSFTFCFLGLVLGYLLFFAGKDAEIHRLSGFTMGTSYQLQIVELPESKSAEQLAEEVSALLTEMDRGLFSTYAAESELSQFNAHAANLPFAASEHLMAVLKQAQDISVLTGGAFDITVGPLVNLWGFGPDLRLDEDQIPSEEEVSALLQSIGYRYLLIDSNKQEIVKSKDITVDLSGIAKGYAVDQVARYLDALGVESYFLEVGGELKIKGLKPGDKTWVPAIEAPLDTTSQIYEVFFSHGEEIAVAGSGDYRNYFENEGVRYSHEIDPRSGYPISHRLAAVYVIDASTARADALATAYMVMGFDAARNLAEEERQAAYFIYKEEQGGFQDYATAAFSKYLLIEEE